MTTSEYLLNKLPYFLSKKEEVKCPCCGKLTTKEISYELELRIQPNEGKVFYLLYYRIRDWCRSYEAPDYIGEIGGLGYPSIKKAIKNLLSYKREIKKWLLTEYIEPKSTNINYEIPF